MQENKENITHIFCSVITEDKIHVDISITDEELANILYNLAKNDEKICKAIELVKTQLDIDNNINTND